MKLVCEFVGGIYSRTPMTLEIAEKICTGRSRDWSEERSQGALVPRAELDNKPTFDGYLGPMWDGLRYEVDGKTYYAHDLNYNPELRARVEAENIEPFGVLRYETQQVYDLLSR